MRKSIGDIKFKFISWFVKENWEEGNLRRINN